MPPPPVSGIPGETQGVERLLGLLVTVAFVAGVSGAVIWAGRRDAGTSWYPWPSPTAAVRLMAVGAAAAVLAAVTWVFTTMV